MSHFLVDIPKYFEELPSISLYHWKFNHFKGNGHCFRDDLDFSQIFFIHSFDEKAALAAQINLLREKTENSKIPVPPDNLHYLTLYFSLSPLL